MGMCEMMEPGDFPIFLDILHHHADALESLSRMSDSQTDPQGDTMN
jgi:hypothetical protein